MPSQRPELSVPGNLQRSIAELLEHLVRVPSRAGVDPSDNVFSLLSSWLGTHHVPCRALTGKDGRVVALAGRVGGLPGAAAYVLNATVDTAGFGDPEAWTGNPTSADSRDGWLHGRGSADSKAGLAVFCHLLAAFSDRDFPRPLGFVFDADEHTGHFGGIRSFLDSFDGAIAGVVIGYPGYDQIGIGARGFWRATIHVRGKSAHSGSSRSRGTNAVVKASRLIAAVSQLDEESADDTTEAFPLPPRLTITGIRGGGEFSSIPDRCEVDLDVRLTPAFPVEVAEVRVHALVEQIDAQWPSERKSEVLTHGSVPAYRLAPDSGLVTALSRAGEQILGRRLPLVVTGPSNVGNLLAQRGIDATCGFGVSYRNVHAPDECVELSSLVPVFRVYERALEQLLWAKGLAA